MGIDEGLSFSDFFDDDISADVKPTYSLTPMEESDWPIQAKDLFGGLWEKDSSIKIKSLLSETHLEDLYHATNDNKLLKILKSGAIKLAFAGGTQSDEELNRGYPFFLSTMRVKYGNYVRRSASDKHISYDVIIHLDGRKLTSAGFKLFPVSYWGGSGENSEQEERVVSTKDEIRPLESFVKDIHVYVNNKEIKHSFTLENLHEINNIAQHSKIPIYFYPSGTEEYFRTQRTEKAVRNISDLLSQPNWTPDELEHKEWLRVRGIGEPERESERARYLQSFLKIYKGEPLDLSKYPDKNIMSMLLYYKHDAYPALAAEVHNLKTYHPTIFREIVSIMKKEKVKTFKSLVNIVMDREGKKEDERRSKEREEYEKRKLNESHEVHWKGNDYIWNGDTFCVFILYQNDQGHTTYIASVNEPYNKFFSDDKELEKKLNKELDVSDIDTHDELINVINYIEDILPDKLILEGRIFRIPISDGRYIFGFWQSISEVQHNFSYIRDFLNVLSINPVEIIWSTDGGDVIGTYKDVFSGSMEEPDKKDVLLKRLIHLSDTTKKGLLKLPPNKLQTTADKLGITVVQLRQSLGKYG